MIEMMEHNILDDPLQVLIATSVDGNILNVLDRAITVTNQYIESVKKSQRKEYGQFFTCRETARYMASIFDLDDFNNKITVLDAGAGTGILSIALIERLEKFENINEIELTCYENDEFVLNILRANLEFAKSHSRLKVKYRIINENYITRPPHSL